MSEGIPPPRELRGSSALRSVVIGALIAAYGYFVHQPQASFTASLLIAAGLQLAVVLTRKYVPTYLMPQVLDVFELLADALTVLLFALGVYGGILRLATEA